MHNPYKDHWFADPFILDATDDNIIVLVEDMPINKSIFKKNKVRGKASISKLTVNRHTYKIEKREVILDLPTHLSFPNILRKENKIYVYPENAYGGTLSLYEFDEKANKLIFKKTILDEVVWDSEITDMFGVEMIFTCKQNDYHLDIYKKNAKTNKFIYWQSVESDHRNMRMAGQLFKIGDKIYCPSQNSDRNYGNATEIKEVQYKDGKFSFKTIRTLTSTHPILRECLHTLNEYKNVVVIDVNGYNYPRIAKILLILKSIFKINGTSSK